MPHFSMDKVGYITAMVLLMKCAIRNNLARKASYPRLT